MENVSDDRKYFVYVALVEGDKQRIHGPFASYVEAHDFGRPFAEEGLDVEVRTDEPICDFCSTRQVGWSYFARDFRVADPDLGWGSRGGWAACDSCHEYIEANDRKRLAQRSAELFFKFNPQIPDDAKMRKIILDHVRVMHEVFFQVRIGEGQKGIKGL
jgi:hypothetical protein